LDDSEDALQIGLGAALGTTPRITIRAAEVVVNDLGIGLDFRVEGNNHTHAIFLQASSDRVGINESSPDTILHISDSSDPTIRITNTDTTGNVNQTIGEIQFEGSDASTNANGIRANIEAQYGGVGGAARLIFSTAGENSTTLVQNLRLNSSNTIFNDTSVDLDFKIESNLDTDSFVLDGGTGAIKMVGPSGVDGSPLTTVTLTVEEGGFNNGNTFQVTNTSGGVRFCSSGYGVIGVGIQPEIWDSTYKALQIGDAGALFGGDDNSFVAVSANVYYDDINNRYEYINDDFASVYEQVNGTHIFKTAASGSADGAITLNEVMRMHPTGQISIGTSSAPTSNSLLLIQGDGGTDNTPLIEFQNTATGNDENLGGFLADIGTDSVAEVSARRESSTSSGYLRFATQPTGGGLTERMRITAGGDVTTTGANFARANPGFTARSGDSISMSRDNGSTLEINRSNDGQVVNFRSATNSEGGISISGNTVSYNSFSGSHWSRLADNSQPTILKGTLIENIDEMCDWYLVTFTVPAITSTDGEGNSIVSQAEHVVTEEIGLPVGKSVGDEMEHIYSINNTTYTGTISKAGDNKHPKCKISDTADSTRIYGVFAAWDHDDANVNDMYVTAVGTHVVRVHGGQTVSAGDLLVSNGDGTAKVQDDDIIRSKTLGKVLTHIKQETYADNSYTVPCALYCG